MLSQLPVTKSKVERRAQRGDVVRPKKFAKALYGPSSEIYETE